MRKYLVGLAINVLVFTISGYTQVKNVIVEKYYISDSNDATDTTDGRSLDSGSVTYRVYIEMFPGNRIKRIYGDSTHLLKIESTADFFNNVDRPQAYFGYLINKSWFANNPTLALDSWLTLGLATRVHNGVLKTKDPDGSIIGGSYNYGGTAGISGGLLADTNSSAGIPLTTSDGLAPNSNIPGQWIDFGFRDSTGLDTTVFGSVNTGSHFISDSIYLQQNSGITGASADSNKVLVAQLTTKGELSFELNVVITDSSGTDINYIAKGHDASFTLPSGQHIIEEVSAFLTYPPVCGCLDPHYLEYNTMFACENNDSCHTLIVFGCMDTNACNYNPNANFNIPNLCCYPGYCNDRDISVVCESLNHFRFMVHPNPVQNSAAIEISISENKETKYEVYNSLGNVVFERDLGIVSGTVTEQLDLTGFANGLYLLHLTVGDVSEIRKILKN